MKKILISIPFVILFLITIFNIAMSGKYLFGMFGILSFEFIDPVYEFTFLFCFGILPFGVLTYGYTRLAKNSGVNFQLISYWLLAIFGSFAVALPVILQILFNILRLPTNNIVELLPTMTIYICLAILGGIGLVNHYFKKRSHTVSKAEQ